CARGWLLRHFFDYW
nr:immunoglobulin heavy chain junction region [Mus musculus]